MTDKLPNSAKYRRYVEVAWRFAKLQQDSDRIMWAELASLWDTVADRIAAKEARLVSHPRSSNRT
jgi:hypothetical protein